MLDTLSKRIHQLFREYGMEITLYSAIDSPEWGPGATHYTIIARPGK